MTDMGLTEHKTAKSSSLRPSKAPLITLCASPRLTCVDIDYMAAMPSSPKELPQSFGAILMKPSGLVPLMMSLAALADVVVSIAIFGIVHETDEGTAAHIWQLLMAGQMPILAFFAVKWLPRAPRQTVPVVNVELVEMMKFAHIP